MQEKWLVRLKNAEAEEGNDLISTYYTENPEQALKTFYFCKEHNMIIYIPHSSNYFVDRNKEAGTIFDIEVLFGSKEDLCCIDIWLENIY